MASSIPGEFTQPEKPTKPLTVVKLRTGEKVHLLASRSVKKQPPVSGHDFELRQLKLLQKPLSPDYASSTSPVVSPTASVFLETAKMSGDSSAGLQSPEAVVSFSPRDRYKAEAQVQIKHTMAEVLQSEYVFVKSLQLLGRFFVEPILVKCSVVGLTCTPLINMEHLLHQLTQKHEEFLDKTSLDTGISTYASEVNRLFEHSAYGAYSACAEMLLVLIYKQVPPFESSYIDNLQRFLEKNQPGDQRMDLSISSLLQKPMGRIAKYRLFLSALAKYGPNQFLHQASEELNGHLVMVNEQIKENKKREDMLESWANTCDYSVTGLDNYFYGLINHTCQCTVQYIADRRGVQSVVSQVCKIMVHDYHLVVVEFKTPRLLFVLPFSNCQLNCKSATRTNCKESNCKNCESRNCKDCKTVSSCKTLEAGHKTGLCKACRIVLEKNGSQYEITISSENAKAHGDFLAHCSKINDDSNHRSDRDCYVGVPVVPLDKTLGQTLTPESCYFRAADFGDWRKRWLRRMW